MLALNEVLLWSVLNLNANITLQSYMSLDELPTCAVNHLWGLEILVFFIRTPHSLSSKGPFQKGDNDSQ